MAKKEKQIRSTGLGTYVDDRGRNIVYDRFSKKAYYITKTDEQKFSLYGMRYPLAIIVGYLLAYNFNLYLGIGIGILIFVVGEGLYRFIFLRNLNEVPRFNKPDPVPFYVQLAFTMSKRRLSISAFVSFLLAALLVYSAELNQYDTASLVLNYIFAFAAAIYGLLHILAITYKKNVD